MNDSFNDAVIALNSFNSGEPLIITRESYDVNGYEYVVNAYVQTIVDWTPKYVSSIQLKLILPFSYPKESPVVMFTQRGMFHPNFTADGVWNDSVLRENENMSDYLHRLIRTLQYKDINEEALGNRNAMGWYLKNKLKGIFPTDEINYKPKLKIEIISRNDPII